MSDPISGTDHTGEVWGNKEILGPGGWKDYKRKTWKGTTTIRLRMWRWKCRTCGTEGESRHTDIKRFPHRCTPEELAAGAKDKPWVCTAQCRGCGHHRTITFGVRCCLYILDTHHRRPQVDLRRETCPVRDPDFRPKKEAPLAPPGPEAIERLARIAKGSSLCSE